MGFDKIDLQEAGVQLAQPAHRPAAYADLLGKIKIEVFPDSCSKDDLYKAINFLQTLVAEKEKAK